MVRVMRDELLRVSKAAGLEGRYYSQKR